MKVFCTQQIKNADAYTIKNEPIPSIDLMERASENCFNWIVKNIDFKNKKFLFFCGTGNNGGDGLAIARKLTESKADVTTFILGFLSKKSYDFSENEKRLKNTKNNKIIYLNDGDSFPVINKDNIVVDTVFGSGLSKPVTGYTAELIHHINQHSHFTISIDIPSGLFADSNLNNDGAIIKASVTLSLQFPKMSFFFPDYGHFAGRWVIIPIGLHPVFIEQEECWNYFTLINNIKPLLKQRNKFAHKGHYGHALLMAGSKGKMGAAVLASMACLRTGAGLLTLYVPEVGADIIHNSVPEAMVIADDDKIITSLKDNTYNAIAVGPGIGFCEAIRKRLKYLLSNCKVPLVLDADAINIISKNSQLKDKIPPDTILTPHIKEFERFADQKFNNDILRFEKQKELSIKYHIFIILKGAYTCITAPDGNAYFNSTGNPGMATAGSGDVLTGVILGLLSQKYKPLDAALLGVFLHGLAGDLASNELSEHSLIASDIIRYLPYAYKQIIHET